MCGIKSQTQSQDLLSKDARGSAVGVLLGRDVPGQERVQTLPHRSHRQQAKLVLRRDLLGQSFFLPLEIAGQNVTARGKKNKARPWRRAC